MWEVAQEMAEGADKPVLEMLKECLVGLRGKVTAEGQASLDALEGLPKRLKISKAATDEAHKALVNVRCVFYFNRPHRRLGRGSARERRRETNFPFRVPTAERSSQCASLGEMEFCVGHNHRTLARASLSSQPEGLSPTLYPLTSQRLPLSDSRRWASPLSPPEVAVYVCMGAAGCGCCRRWRR